MTAPRLVVSNLGLAEDKLRRSLGLVGEVGTTFEPALKPISIVDDATRPGTSNYRGRRFAFGEDANLAVVGASSVALKALDGIIINKLYVPNQGTNGVLVTVRYVPADVADPYAISTLVPWVDNGKVSGDSAPVVCTPAIAADSALGSVIWSFVTGSTAPADWEPCHLPRDAKLIVRFSALIANCTWGFSGQVF